MSLRSVPTGQAWHWAKLRNPTSGILNLPVMEVKSLRLRAKTWVTYGEHFTGLVNKQALKGKI